MVSFSSSGREFYCTLSFHFIDLCPIVLLYFIVDAIFGTGIVAVKLSIMGEIAREDAR